MALPASGPISMSQVRTELQNDGKSTDLSLHFLGSMSGSGANRTSGYTPLNQSSLTKPSIVPPSSLSEWYSYDHSTNKACGNPLNPIVGAYYTYVRYEVTGPVGSTSTTTMTMPTNAGNTVKCHIYTGSYPFTNLGTLTGTPMFNGTFTTAGSQYYSFTLASTSTILHIVAWDETIPAGNYLFAISPSCGTTTTTTTQPPLALTNGAVTCTGNSGSWTSTFSGGSGTYHTAALDTVQSNVGNLLGNGTGGSAASRLVILSPGATSYNWTNIGSGSWYVGVKDSAGATDIEAISINCTTTTTSTTTTTTTAAPASNFQYTATRCSTGASVTVISATSLTRFSTYATSPSGQSECYTITTNGTSTSSSPTATFYLLTTDCTDATRCFQA